MNWISVKDSIPESGETVLVASLLSPEEPFSTPDNAFYGVCTFYQPGDMVFNEVRHKPVEGAESMSEEELREAVFQMMEENADEEVEIQEAGFYYETTNEYGLQEWRRLDTVMDGNPMGIMYWCEITPPEDK